VKWLAAAGLGSSLAVVRLISWFPWSIDQQLRLDSGLGMWSIRSWPCYPRPRSGVWESTLGVPG